MTSEAKALIRRARCGTAEPVPFVPQRNWKNPQKMRFCPDSRPSVQSRKITIEPGLLAAWLVLSVDNMNAKVSGRESLNGAAEPGRDLLEIDVFDGTKSVRAKNRCNTSRLETADRTFINFLKLFGPLCF